MTSPTPDPPRRPPGRRVLHVLRRAHLFAGLLLLPWVLLYGVTGFLFNHPNALADQPVRPFGPADIRGTPLEQLPTPAETAERAVAALNAGGPRFSFVQPEQARFTREYAFATVKTGTEVHSVLVEVADGSGVIRSKPADPPAPPPAPFARKGGLATPDPAHERVKAALREVFARRGVEYGEVTVTSVPDVSFLMRDADGALWRVTYNPQTGAVSGVPADAVAAPELSARRFATGLHKAHGYPAAGGGRWWWAVLVDVLSGVMVFWAVSGLFMWWQVKAVRLWGGAALLLSAGLAAWLGVAMHGAMR